METRDQFPDAQGLRGVETVIFSSDARRIGKLGPWNFELQWHTIENTVRLGEFLGFWCFFK